MERSPLLFGLFRRYARSYLRRHFHAVRLARNGFPRVRLVGPLLIVLNHPSWWDPLVGLLLTHLFPERTHYAPIEAKALGRYAFFRKLGFFGVEPGTVAGARNFLQAGQTILARPEAALWLTAQGRFTDVRERPPGLRPGVGHLVHAMQGGAVLPLALEYSFWDERLPEALARFGDPIRVEDGKALRAAEWRALVEDELAHTQDRLAVAARARDRDAFTVLLDGKRGIGGVYDLWRRFRSRWRGEQFQPEHVPEVASQ